MLPAPPTYPPQSWPDLEEAFLNSLPGDGREAGREALSTWHTALGNEITTGIADIILDNLSNERHFSLAEKAMLLHSALLWFEPSARFTGEPLATPFRYDSPSEALREACRAYAGRGTPIERSEGDVAHFITFSALTHFYPRKGAPAAENSLTQRSWRDLLAGAEFKMETEIVEALQGMVWPYFSTLADWVDDLGVSGGTLAARIRDLLGCPHFDGEELVEFRITDEVARAECFNKPTFADAEAYPPFLPSREEDEYGYARDLGGEGRGGPEIWHRCLLAQSHAARLLEVPSQPIPSELWREYRARKK